MPSPDAASLRASRATSSAAREGSGGAMSRRELLLSGAAAALSACSGARAPAAPELVAPRAVELWSAFDLPAEDPRSRELSGIAWDAQARVLWAVHDHTPAVVALVPDRDLRAWRFGETVGLEIDGPVDLEGVALLPDGFLVCSELGPRVVELDRAGRFRRDLELPARLRGARENKSLESLTLAPSRRFVFTTTETALEVDGAEATPRSGARVRIVRLAWGGADRGAREYAYETDPLPHDAGDWGVADLAALDDARLLVLERGWTHGYGNTVRIYETTLDPRARCAEAEALSSGSPALRKSLVVDLEKLDATGVPGPKQPQPTPLLDNFEGLALGPTLPDGRATLLLVSDDNGRTDQHARVVVLAL